MDHNEILQSRFLGKEMITPPLKKTKQKQLKKPTPFPYQQVMLYNLFNTSDQNLFWHSPSLQRFSDLDFKDFPNHYSYFIK